MICVPAFDSPTRRSIADRYVAGESSRKLAAEFFCNHVTVLKYVKEFYPKYNRLARSGNHHPIDVAQVLRVWTLAGAGDDQNTICRKMGMSCPAVQRALDAQKIVRALAKPKRPTRGALGPYCPRCDELVEPGDLFCRYCGQELEGG